jgi:hypothetical protein
LRHRPNFVRAGKRRAAQSRDHAGDATEGGYAACIVGLPGYTAGPRESEGPATGGPAVSKSSPNHDCVGALRRALAKAMLALVAQSDPDACAETLSWPGVGTLTISFQPDDGPDDGPARGRRHAAGRPRPSSARRVILFTLMSAGRPLTTTRLVAEANRLGHVLSESTAAKCLRQMVRDGELAAGRGPGSAGYWFPDGDDDAPDA